MARRVEVWDLVGSRPSTLGLESVGAWLDVEDANADDQAELWLLADVGDLVQLAWTDGLNARRTLAILPDPGPLAAADQTGDGVAEAFVAGGSAWRWWPGKTALVEYFKFQDVYPRANAVHVNESEAFYQIMSRRGKGDTPSELAVPRLAKIWEFILWQVIFWRLKDENEQIANACLLDADSGTMPRP